LLIAGWYPTAQYPLNCIFIKEHAQMITTGNDVVVLHSEGIDSSIKGWYTISDEIEDGLRTLRLRYKRLPVPRSSQLLYLYAMFAAVRHLRHEGFKPDLIHAHIYVAGLVAILLGKRYRIPVIISEHASDYFRNKIRLIEKMRTRYAFRQADLVCPVSESLRQMLEMRGIQAKFRVVPNLVDTSYFTTAENPVRLDNRKRLLFVGNMLPLKGLPYLLQALQRLKMNGRDDFVLDVVGQGPHRSEYETLADTLGLSAHVAFHGSQPREAVARFMRACDFFVLPTLYETFGIVVIEALASGKPVIASHTSGPREILNEKLGILVPPQDSAALASAIDHMLDHFQEYDPAALHAYAHEHYGHEAVLNQWTAIYQSLIAARRPG
jgi:glycosyltransferase involved in cell wall biosynthesis